MFFRSAFHPRAVAGLPAGATLGCGLTTGSDMVSFLATVFVDCVLALVLDCTSGRAGGFFFPFFFFFGSGHVPEGNIYT